jgi:NAD(P)-dependent dehydrogenase (short-subunit alcohol dehydrogenase family)
MIASAAGASVSSSKGDVNGLGLTLEQSLAEENIRVNAPCPGNIATPLKLGIIYQQV